MLWLGLLALIPIFLAARNEVRLEALRARAGAQAAHGPRARPRYADLLLDLARALPGDDVWLQAIEEERGRAQVRGRTWSAAAADAYLRSLEERPSIAAGRMERIQGAADGGFRFQMELEIAAGTGLQEAREPRDEEEGGHG